MTQQTRKQDSFHREVGRGLVERAKDSLRSAAIGALIGAVIVGVAGLYYFGFYGFVVGSILGAVLGGGMFWFAYMDA